MAPAPAPGNMAQQRHPIRNELEFALNTIKPPWRKKTMYSYQNKTNLSSAELFFWITVDKTLEQLGVEDIGAVFAILAGQPIIPTRAKVGGATKGTSVASVVSRQILNYDLKIRLPMLTGSSIKTLRIALTKNLGAFVGRTIPVVGWFIVANDVVRITWNTATAYNSIVSLEDRLAR